MDDRSRQLIDAVQRLSSARTHEEIQAIVKTAARALVSADGATFVLRDRENCHYVDEDAIAPLWKGKRFPLTSCITGWVMLHRQPTAIPDIYADDRIPHAAYRPTFVQSLAAIPIRRADPIAAIGIYWAARHEVTEDEMGVLGALADSTAVAMEMVGVHLELEDRVRRRTAELHARNEELSAASEKIRRLEGVVKMCAWTRRLDLDGRWVPVEEWIQERLGLDITHGISPEALSAMEAEAAKISPPQ